MRTPPADAPVPSASANLAAEGVTAPRRTRMALTTDGVHRNAFGWSEWGLLAGVATIWGSSFLFMAIGLEAFRPGVVTMARVVLGAAALALVPRARKAIAREDRARVAVLGIVWIGIPLSLFPIAQQWIDSSVAGMFNGAVPLTTVAWSAVLLGRLPARRQLAGIALGFVGVMAIFQPELTESSATTLGSILVLGAVTLYGLAANMAVPLQQRYGALPVLLRAQLAALFVVVPYGLFHLPGSSWAWTPALAMIPLGVLGTGLAFVLMTTLVGRVGGPRGSIAIYFVPLVAIALGIVVRSEQVAPIAVAGSLLVLIGAWITSRAEDSPALEDDSVATVEPGAA